MRHNKKIKHLGRTSAHRKSMLSNMAASLIMQKRIFTTVPKAKALKRVVEPVITRSKVDTTHSRRIAFRTLQDKEALNELFQNVSQKVGDRPGGYTRILRTGHRLGDNAPMCFIELVDYNENMLKETAAPTRRRRRRRRKSSSSQDATASTPETVESSESDVESKSDVEDVKPTEDIQSEKDESKTEKE